MNDAQRPLSLRPLDLARALVRWPVESQLASRRNALVASTLLTEVTRERRDVEEFLDRLEPPDVLTDRIARPEEEPDPWTGERSVI